MVNFNITNDDKEIIKSYRTANYLMVNQLLVSQAEIDVALLREAINNDIISISYDKESMKKNIEFLKKIYEIMLKVYYKKENKDAWALVYSSTIAETQMLKNEIYIDNFLTTTSNKEEAKKNIDVDMPAMLNICGDGNIPVINIDEILEHNTNTPEFLIAPFTKIKDFKEIEAVEIENSRMLRIYNVTLEKQELQELNKEEKQSVYTYIMSSADIINKKLEECVAYEEEIIQSNESIRKLEQLLSKYELEVTKKIQGKDYPASERTADTADIDRIKSNIAEVKERISSVFEEKKSAIDFITKWKKNVAVYVMAEFKELEMQYAAEAKVQKINQDVKKKKLEQEALEKHEKLKEESLENIAKAVNKECDENIILAERLLNDIKSLILKQQNHAKIAGNMGATYSALNNGFDMRKVAENLLNQVKQVKEKAKELCENEDRDLLSDKLLNISNVNVQISTLINYLNNPKSSVGKAKISRFDEMAIIEENELKRAIAEKILNVRGEAELKKLKDDLEILEEKGAFKRFIGFFTGANKLDEIKEEQIEVRQKAIRKTLSQKMSLVYNYSIHELVAEIQMFLNDNEDDELIEEDVYILENMENELRRNFIISDSKVQDIIMQKENKNLPIEAKKITKRELIEIETYRFLSKYGYDRRNEEAEVAYQDTMQNEIARIVDYISSSGILD